MKTSLTGRACSKLVSLALPLALLCAAYGLQAAQVANPTVTAAARPFNATFNATNLFDAANAEFASMSQGAVSAPFTTDPNNGTWVEMDFGSTIQFDRFVLRTRANAADVIGQSRLIVSADATFDSSDRIFTFDPTGSNGSGPVRNLYELVSGRYARWEVITRTGSGVNLGANQMWFLKTPAGHSLLAPPTVINSSPPFSGGFPPAAAVNGDYGIEYASLGAQAAMFIDFDFGFAQPITGFEFLNRFADRVTTFDLVFADTPDFVAPTLTLSFTADANGNFVNSATFFAVNARYVRLQATGYDPTGAANTGVREIQFFTVTGQQPTITQSPVGGMRLAGDAFTLSAAAIGDIPIGFQWLLDGAPIPGATNSILVFTNLQATNAGNYAVEVNNVHGSVISDPPAVLTVLDPPIDTTTDLRLHLKFDETTGPVAIDDSGNARDGTLTGFPGDDSQWVAGRIDGAIRVNPEGAAGDDVVLVADDGGLDFSSSLEFSLSAWVNGAATQEGGAPVFSKGTGGGGEQYALDVNGGAYRFYVRNAAAGAVIFQSTNRPNDTWQHLAVVYSTPLNRVKFYVNGVETLSGTPSPTLLQNAHEVSLGSRQQGAAEYNLNFNGRLDDARIYGRVLTAADVMTLFNAAALIPPSIATPPASATVFAFEPATLLVVADGSPPLSYQWFKGGSPIGGATNAGLTLNNVTTNDAGSYTVRVTNSRGTTNSPAAVLTVVDPEPNLASGLVLHLKLDETSGTTASDSSGLNNNGTLQGFADPPPWTSGIVDGALTFNPDGAAGDDVVLVPDAAPLNFDASLEFSFSAWANGNPVQEAGAPVICKGTGGGGEQFSLDVFNGYRFYGWTGAQPNGVYVVSTPTGPNNTWQHLVGVFSRPLNRLKLYLNGNEVANGTPSATIVASTHEVTVGSRQTSSGAYDLNFNGIIDDVRLYNRVLTPREVKSLNELGNNQPRLAIVRSAGSVTISWPASFTGFTLESSDVVPATTWTPVAGVVNNSVTLSTSGASKFYRLRKP